MGILFPMDNADAMDDMDSDRRGAANRNGAIDEHMDSDRRGAANRNDATDPKLSDRMGAARLKLGKVIMEIPV